MHACKQLKVKAEVKNVKAQESLGSTYSVVERVQT